MHQHLVNASLQIVPIVQDKHPYVWVDEAIAVIAASGIKHEVGPFATVIEGTYDEVMRVVHQVNEYLQQQHCDEWILNFQLQVRSNRDITAAEKTDKFQDQ